MIQPGQKLKEGDYFRGGTIEEYLELLKIESKDDGSLIQIAQESVRQNFICFSEYLNELNWLFSAIKTEYNFADFKQLCENTFGDGSV